VGKTLEKAQASLRNTYLPRLIRGEFVASFATSEPGASTDLSRKSVQTVLEHQGKLPGQVKCILDAGIGT
jgi:alkylation response protein AidB-like acyl-CoA dehydrogenase